MATLILPDNITQGELLAMANAPGKRMVNRSGQAPQQPSQEAQTHAHHPGIAHARPRHRLAD